MNMKQVVSMLVMLIMAIFMMTPILHANDSKSDDDQDSIQMQPKEPRIKSSDIIAKCKKVATEKHGDENLAKPSFWLGTLDICLEEEIITQASFILIPEKVQAFKIAVRKYTKELQKVNYILYCGKTEGLCGSMESDYLNEQERKHLELLLEAVLEQRFKFYDLDNLPIEESMREFYEKHPEMRKERSALSPPSGAEKNTPPEQKP